MIHFLTEASFDFGAAFAGFESAFGSAFLVAGAYLTADLASVALDWVGLVSFG